MFTCFHCKTHHKNSSDLCKHLKFKHGLYPAKNLRLKCGEQGFPLSFCTYSGFRKLLNIVHRQQHDEQALPYQEVDTKIHSEVEFFSDQPSTSASLLQDPPSVPQNSLKAMCGSRIAPLIVVERENSHWTFVLLLLQIVNVVFSPILTDAVICYLKHLIYDHHTMFKTLYPDKKLILKHHLMIHYPRCIKKIGPLIHMWCMRFEAKHFFLKSL